MIAKIDGIYYLIHLIDLVHEHVYTDEELWSDGYVYAVGEFRQKKLRFDQAPRYVFRYSGADSDYLKIRDRISLQDPVHGTYFVREMCAKKWREKDMLLQEIPTE